MWVRSSLACGSQERMPFIADSILSPGMIVMYTKGLFRNLSRTGALAPQPRCPSLTPSCCFWIVDFPAWLWLCFKSTHYSAFGFVFCFELTGTFEAHPPLGNSVAPLWDIRNCTRRKQAGFYNVSSLHLPILFVKQKAPYRLSFFWGGNRTGYRGKGCKNTQSPPLPSQMCASNTLRPLLNQGQKRTTSRLRARGGFEVRRGRCFLDFCFLCVGTINGVNWGKAPPDTAVLFQILADPHNFDRAPTVALGS